MKTARLICFSMTGLLTAERIAQGLKNNGWDCHVSQKSRYLPDSITESTKEWAGNHFGDSEALLFVGACGIAVRSIAPYIVTKKEDPAVLVIDECGHYVISLLSGHLGGANALTQEVAEILGAAPVVTTATDLHGQFAVDLFAKKNHCSIFHMKAAKEVSAAILAGEPVGFYSEFPIDGELPQGVLRWQPGDAPLDLGIAVTVHKNMLPFASTVQVVPPAVVLGMGCRRDKEYEDILALASSCMETLDLFPESIASLNSIDLKKEEPGLLTLSEHWKIPFITYSAEELREAPGEYAPSAFVNKITGVDNVCERSAVLASDNGTVLQHKIAQNGVTAALAIKKWRVQF